MRDAAIVVALFLFILCGGSLMIYRTPAPPTDMKHLTALQVDRLIELHPDGELEYSWRFRWCRNEVWWYAYANHDEQSSTRNCWQ